MKILFKKSSLVVTAIWSALVMGFTTGCASGGFKLTRMYAGFVNRQMIILRIILYIFTTVVFGVTMLIDLVVFNTIDFWKGTVSSGNYEFQKDGKMYAVQHKILPDSGLRESRIEIFDNSQESAQLSQAVNKKPNQIIVLSETKGAEIEVFINGVLKAKVHDINELKGIPTISQYNDKGQQTEAHPIWTESQYANR